MPLTIAGTIITIWASMGVFGAITSAVNHAWGTEKPYGYFKHKLIAFVMMAAALVLLLMTALLLVGATERLVSTRAARSPTLDRRVGLIYYFAPNTKVRLRDVWFGAVLAGVLWRARRRLRLVLPRLLALQRPGSVGTVVAFLVWVYLSAVILLYGVEVTAAYARERQRIPDEMPAAPPLQ